MLSLLIGWRSLIRHKRRTIITGLAVALSLALMLVFVGLGDDGHARMAEMGIRLGAGHVLVQGKGYQEEQTLERLVLHPAEVIAAARKLPGVEQAVERVRTSGLLSAVGLSASVMLSGVDPELQPTVPSLASAQQRVSGSYLRRRERSDSARVTAAI